VVLVCHFVLVRSESPSAPDVLRGEEGKKERGEDVRGVVGGRYEEKKQEVGKQHSTYSTEEAISMCTTFHYYNVLYHNSLYSPTCFLNMDPLYYTVQHCTILYYTVLYDTVLYYAILYCTTPYYIILHCTTFQLFLTCFFSMGRASASTLSLSRDGVGYPCSRRL
jgi:hypothetical protein